MLYILPIYNIIEWTYDRNMIITGRLSIVEAILKSQYIHDRNFKPINIAMQ